MSAGEQLDDWGSSVGRAISVVTVRGVAVRIHPTMLLLVPWVFWHWGGRSTEPLEGTLFGLFLLLAVFVSVAGHELAHAVVAHRFGLAVRDVVLLPIGGLTRIEQGPLPPRREAAIALAGPVLNLGIALALLPVVSVVLALYEVTSLADVARLLTGTSVGSLLILTMASNVLLALFNLIPAFPMDGGRLLRAWLSALSERARATRISLVTGYLVALVTLPLGLWLREPTLPLAGLFWLVLPCWSNGRSSWSVSCNAFQSGSSPSGMVVESTPSSRCPMRCKGDHAMSLSYAMERSWGCCGEKTSSGWRMSRISCALLMRWTMASLP